MANTTVYPFGTNGTMPSSIGVINDLTTGGADKALSAQMGVQLNEQTEVTETVNTDLKLSLWFYIGSGTPAKYVSHTTYKGFFIPVKAGEVYKVTSGANSTIMGVVTSDSISNNLDVPFATGESRIVTTANSTIYITIPSDGAYIWCNSVLGNGDCVPIIERVVAVAEQARENSDHIGDFDFGAWTAADLTSAVDYNNYICGGTSGGVPIPSKWANVTGRACKMFPIPEGAKFVKVVPFLDAGSTFFILQNNKAPASATQADCSVAYPERILLTKNTTMILPLYDDCKYIAYTSKVQYHEIVVNVSPRFYFATSPTSLTDKLDEHPIIGGQVGAPEFNDAPTTIFSTADNYSTDNACIAHLNVLKISENMYYMYYCAGSGAFSDSTLKVAFAYSTDGINWTRGFPSGITPPVSPDNNLLFSTNYSMVNVAKVPDSAYPYRMITMKWHDSTQFHKSADGITWEQIRSYPYYYDARTSMIVRGNTIKVYMRRRDSETKQIRYIGVAYIDLDGNLLSQPTIFFGKYLYNTGATILDDRREILFPTYYNMDDNEAHLQCFIVDGTKITPQDVDFSTIIDPSVDKWMELNSLVNVGNSMYVYFTVTDKLHGQSGMTRTFKVAKATFTRTGLDGAYW